MTNRKTNSLPSLLKNIYVILCHTSHPGNIGSAARAMKTMGLSQLILVSPNIIATSQTPNPPLFDRNNPDTFTIPEESFILASGAKDILTQAQFFSTLDEAIKPMHLTCALSSRKREISAPLQSPREIMPEIIQFAQNEQKIAFIFGSETFGLNIEEVSLCNRLITINGNPDYFSLNLAQTVQVVAYELFSQLNHPITSLKQYPNLSTRKEVLGLVEHFEVTMQEIGFFEKRNKKRLMRRIQRMIDKSNIEKEEIDILRGFLNLVSHKTKL
ncbi:MAG: RNA methyltransferase [Neisseriaceae bacterium]|nr:MAG: RNA methyltransferase [Neisseriaceae bacterium]